MPDNGVKVKLRSVIYFLINRKSRKWGEENFITSMTLILITIMSIVAINVIILIIVLTRWYDIGLRHHIRYEIVWQRNVNFFLPPSVPSLCPVRTYVHVVHAFVCLQSISISLLSFLYRFGVLLSHRIVLFLLELIWYDMIWYDIMWYDMIWHDTNQNQM